VPSKTTCCGSRRDMVSLLSALEQLKNAAFAGKRKITGAGA
jgi:hypothetical protein